MKTVLFNILRHALTAPVIALSACSALAQDFAIEPLGFASITGTSRDGSFAVSGTFLPASSGLLSGGEFTASGQFQSVVAASLPAAESLVVNGSFENIAGTFTASLVPGLMSLPIGSGTIPGWTTINAELAWGSNENPYGPKTPDGMHFLDLTGFHDGPPYGGIEQTFATMPNQRYKVSFSIGSDQDTAAYSGPMAVALIVAGETNTFSFTPDPPPKGNVWMTFEHDFTATAARTLIMITGSAARGGAYLGLDQVSLVAKPASPDLLVNGSFEDTQNTFVPDASGVHSLAGDSTVIPGWTVVAAETAWVSNNNVYGGEAIEGSMFLDLTGYHDSRPYGGVAQWADTKPGQQYRFSLALGSFEGTSAYRGPVTATVSLGDEVQSFTLNPPGAGNQWSTFTSEFTATASATPIAIVGRASGGGQYLGLDNVSVVPSEAGGLKLKITFPAGNPGNQLQLSFTSEPGKNYAVQSTDNIFSGSWGILPGTERTGTGETIRFDLPNVISQQARFFRLQTTR